MTKPKHIKGPRKKRIQFTCLVDEELFLEANKARITSWPEIVENAFTWIVNQKHLRTHIEITEGLNKVRKK